VAGTGWKWLEVLRLGGEGGCWKCTECATGLGYCPDHERMWTEIALRALHVRWR